MGSKAINEQVNLVKASCKTQQGPQTKAVTLIIFFPNLMFFLHELNLRLLSPLAPARYSKSFSVAIGFLETGPPSVTTAAYSCPIRRRVFNVGLPPCRPRPRSAELGRAGWLWQSCCGTMPPSPGGARGSALSCGLLCVPRRGLRAGAALAHREGPILAIYSPKADPSGLYRPVSVRLLSAAKETGKRWEIPFCRFARAKGREGRARNRGKSDDGAGDLPAHQLTSR